MSKKTSGVFALQIGRQSVCFFVLILSSVVCGSVETHLSERVSAREGCSSFSPNRELSPRQIPSTIILSKDVCYLSQDIGFKESTQASIKIPTDCNLHDQRASFTAGTRLKVVSYQPFFSERKSGCTFKVEPRVASLSQPGSEIYISADYRNWQSETSQASDDQDSNHRVNDETFNAQTIAGKSQRINIAQNGFRPDKPVKSQASGFSETSRARSQKPITFKFYPIQPDSSNSLEKSAFPGQVDAPPKIPDNVVPRIMVITAQHLNKRLPGNYQKTGQTYKRGTEVEVLDYLPKDSQGRGPYFLVKKVGSDETPVIISASRKYSTPKDKVSATRRDEPEPPSEEGGFSCPEGSRVISNAKVTGYAPGKGVASVEGGCESSFGPNPCKYTLEQYKAGKAPWVAIATQQDLSLCLSNRFFYIEGATHNGKMIPFRAVDQYARSENYKRLGFIKADISHSAMKYQHYLGKGRRRFCLGGVIPGHQKKIRMFRYDSCSDAGF